LIPSTARGGYVKANVAQFTCRATRRTRDSQILNRFRIRSDKRQTPNGGVGASGELDDGIQ
jgi:hypothetical protein